MESIGVEWILRREPRTLQLIEDGVEHGCDVCSRHRRGALYRIAAELGANVLALGHTADDCAESLFRNVLFNGRVASGSCSEAVISRAFNRGFSRSILATTQRWSCSPRSLHQLIPAPARAKPASTHHNAGERQPVNQTMASTAMPATEAINHHRAIARHCL
jgi:hypothetical protein